MTDEQDATPTLSDMSLIPPKLPNFPLPRELRDQIYSYLLDGEHVSIKRKWNGTEAVYNSDNDLSGRRAYNFYTSILGVNHAIHDEAEELLYKRNMFVILSYKYFRLGGQNGGLVWLPIVSNKHVARMKSHSVRIHVSPGTAGLKNPMTSGDAPIQSAIFLARNLDAFCLIMTTAGASCSQTNLTVTLCRNGAGVPTIERPGLFSVANRAAPQFRCELRNTKYRQIDAATQRQILSPMVRILAPSQRVFFQGIVCDFQEVEHQKQAMSPSLNCFPASKWALFEASSLAESVADAAVPHDEVEFVMRLYLYIALTLGTCTYTNDDDRRRRQYLLMTYPEVVDACDILALEALVNTACCAVKMGDKRILRDAGESILAAMKRREAEQRSWEIVPADLKRLCYNAMLWKNLYCGESGYLATVEEVVEYLASSTDHPHIAHDTKIFMRQPDQEAVVALKHLPHDQCSAVQLPLPHTAYHNHLLKQERCKGWLDMDLLRSLPEDLKQQVNQQQKQHKIKVTAFDEILQ